MNTLNWIIELFKKAKFLHQVLANFESKSKIKNFGNIANCLGLCMTEGFTVGETTQICSISDICDVFAQK